MSTEVRRLGAADAKPYRDIRLEALRTAPEAFGRTAEEEEGLSLDTIRCRLRGNAVFAAFDGNRPVGLAGLQREEGRKSRHKVFLWGMYVAPSHRRRGVGRLLVERALAHLRDETDVEQVILTVVTENAAAIALYESFGFTTYGTEPRAIKSGDRYHDERRMVLLLR